MFVVNIFAVPKKIIKQDGFFFFLKWEHIFSWANPNSPCSITKNTLHPSIPSQCTAQARVRWTLTKACAQWRLAHKGPPHTRLMAASGNRCIGLFLNADCGLEAILYSLKVLHFKRITHSLVMHIWLTSTECLRGWTKIKSWMNYL